MTHRELIERLENLQRLDRPRLIREHFRSLIQDIQESGVHDVVRSHPQGLDKIRQAPKELAELMQEYIDDSSYKEEGVLRYLEGFDNLEVGTAVMLFNDFLLFVNGGIDPPIKVRGH